MEQAIRRRVLTLIAPQLKMFAHQELLINCAKDLTQEGRGAARGINSSTAPNVLPESIIDISLILPAR